MPVDLESYICNNIPIFGVSKFAIMENNCGTVSVSGRYADHYNHKKTVFGGSISTSLMISAWCQAMVIVRDRFSVSLGDAAGFVVKHQEVDYLKPVEKDFVSTSILPSFDVEKTFFDGLIKHGKNSLVIEAVLLQAGDARVKAHFRGEFVAFLSSDFSV